MGIHREIKDLHVKLADEDKVILDGLSLIVRPGEVHAIMGPNGSGKSTLSYVLAGREGYEVTGGEVLLDGEDLLAMEPNERAARGVFLAFNIRSRSRRRHHAVPQGGAQCLSARRAASPRCRRPNSCG